MKKTIFLLTLILIATLITGCKKDEIKLEGTTWKYTASTDEWDIFDTMTLVFTDNKNFTATAGFFEDDYTETLSGTYVYAYPTITLKLFSEDNDDQLTILDKNTISGTAEVTGKELIFKRQ